MLPSRSSEGNRAHFHSHLPVSLLDGRVVGVAFDAAVEGAQRVEEVGGSARAPATGKEASGAHSKSSTSQQQHQRRTQSQFSSPSKICYARAPTAQLSAAGRGCLQLLTVGRIDNLLSIGTESYAFCFGYSGGGGRSGRHERALRDAVLLSCGERRPRMWLSDRAKSGL